MEEATGAPSSFTVWDPKRLRASGRDGETVMTEPPSPLRMLLSRHTKRREFITLLGGAAAWPLGARAQQSAKILHVGFLYPGPLVGVALRITPFTSGLQAGGLRVPDQVIVIPSVADGNAALLAPMATDLVARKVDAILVIGPEAVRAAHAATTTIPIVAIDLESDPTDSGFISSYARPGGNITGVFLDFPEFSKKWLEAL